MYETFENHSVNELVKVAGEYQRQFAAANNPKKYERWKCALPVSSHYAASAAPGGRFSMNFTSRAVQGLLAIEIPTIEALIDEADHRHVLKDDQALSTLPLFKDLTKQTVKYLDFMRTVGAATVDDLIVMSDEMVEDFALKPVY